MTSENSRTPKSSIGVGRMIAIAVISVAAAVLIFGNLEPTEVFLWGFRPTLPLFVVLIVMFVLGMFLGGMVRTGVRKLRGVDRP